MKIFKFENNEVLIRTIDDNCQPTDNFQAVCDKSIVEKDWGMKIPNGFTDFDDDAVEDAIRKAGC